MLLKNSSRCVSGLILVIAATAAVMQSCQNYDKRFVLNSPVDENTAVRFFYQPAGNYFHSPLVFRVVDQKDSRLNTAPMAVEGRTAYISLSEMRQLMQGLAHSDLSWRESEKVEVLGSFRKLDITDNMEITAVSSKGTAQATLNPQKICETLKPLDSALKTPRALWEFQGFRLNYGCKVPGFVYDAYPDH
jgi:hypothetical protein